MTAEAIETAYQDGGDIADPTERLNAAVEAEFDADSATVRSAVSGGSLGDMSDFLRDASRKAGDAAVVEDASGSGYYVVVFLSREDNHYPTVSVRHITAREGVMTRGGAGGGGEVRAKKGCGTNPVFCWAGLPC